MILISFHALRDAPKVSRFALEESGSLVDANRHRLEHPVNGITDFRSDAFAGGFGDAR
jgi:hypothetical protein